MNVTYVYVYGDLTKTHGGTKRELRQWDNPHISVTPKTNRGYKHQIWCCFHWKIRIWQGRNAFLLLHMKGKLTRDTKISQTRLGVWGSRLDGWVSLPSQKRWTYPGVMGFSSISLRCWDGSISFSTAMSTSQHSTLDDGFSSKDLGDVETKRCENMWKCINTQNVQTSVKTCVQYWSCENVHEMGSLHVRRTCAETCENCADMLQSAYMFMFCFPLKIEHVTASTTRFLMEKNCWWLLVIKCLPPRDETSPKSTWTSEKPISERHLKLWQSSPQSWFTKMVNFTNGSGKDLEIHCHDQKMFLGKTMGKFHLSEMNQFFQVFQTLSFLLYQDLCKRSLVQNIQFDPLKTRVKWTVSKTSWKIHLNFLVGEMGSPSS